MLIDSSLLIPLLPVGGIIFSYTYFIVVDGARLGRPTYRLEVSLAREQLSAFLVRMNHRLEELGFHGDAPVGPFQQGDRKVRVGAPLRAKHLKRLIVTTHDVDAHRLRLEFALSHKQLMVLDAGSKEYGEGILKYITNESDAPPNVPNGNVYIDFSVSLGIWAWLVVIGLKVLHFEPFFRIACTMALTPIVCGIIGIVMIARHPTEVAGLRKCIVGMAIGAAALAAAFVLRIIP